MSLSTLARSIAESPTLRLNEEARRRRELGEPVIHLGIGEPKNTAPMAATLATIARTAQGDVKYTPTSGVASMKKAIIRYTEENYGKVVAPANVIVSSGAKQAIYNALYALLDPDDEVICLAPYWVSYPEMIRMCYGVPVVVTPSDGTFHPLLADIEKAVGPKTKAIIVNSPNNPSGVVYSEQFIAEIVEFCERRGIWAIMDDIYHKLMFDGRPIVSAYKYTSRDLESSRLIVINGVAKTYGMTGYRVGWATGPRELISVMNNVQAQTTSCVSVIVQAGAEAALTGDQGVVDSLRREIQHQRDAIVRELHSFPRVRLHKPEGTFYCLPDFSAYSTDSVKLADLLLEKALVVTVPGREFGMEGHLRLSYSGTMNDVTEGLARMKWALDPDSPREIRIGDRTCVRDWA